MTDEITILKDDPVERIVNPSETKFENESKSDKKGDKVTQINLETEILYYIEQKFPDYYHNNITKPKKVKIAHMSRLLNDFQEIGSQKKKYNLKWAFKEANETFNFEELQKVQPMTDCFVAYDEVVCAVHDQSKAKINSFSRKFSLLSTGVSLLDIMVSVALILVVTLLSHIGDKIFDTLLFSTMFIAAIALTKVSLDRFAIMPLLDRYGWRLFNRTLRLAREEAIKLNAVYCVLMESITRNESIEVRYNLIKKQRKELLNIGGIISLPVVSSPNPME